MLVEEQSSHVVFSENVDLVIRYSIIAVSTTNDTVGLKFDSVEQASKMFVTRCAEEKKVQYIQECLDGKRDTYLGYKWSYMENKEKKTRYNSERVMCIGRTGKEQYHGIVFDSIAQASQVTGIKKENICNCCKDYGKPNPRRKTAGGYKWKYVDRYYLHKDIDLYEE